MRTDRFGVERDPAGAVVAVRDRAHPRLFVAEFATNYAGAEAAARSYAERLNAEIGPDAPNPPDAMGGSPPAVFLTVKQFAARHEGQISPWLIGEAVRRGQLPHVRLGRKILIPEDALSSMVDEQHLARPANRGARKPG